MFIFDKVLAGDTGGFIILSALIFLAINLAHSWLVGPLFIRMSGSQVMGCIFAVAYLGVAVWLCVHTSIILKTAEAVDVLYGLYISLMSIALAGAHTFSFAFYGDWEEMHYLDWEEQSGLNFWWATPAFIASIFLHPIAVCILFVIGAVVMFFVTAEREY